MAETSIQWTDHSINPIRDGKGHFCQMVSPGCAHCYSSRFQPRFGNEQFRGQNTKPKELWLDESKLQEVLRRKKPTKFFWCDMTDLFGDWVPDEWIDKCFATMALAPQHTHQVLTKRPERMASYMTKPSRYCVVREGNVQQAAYMLDPMAHFTPRTWPLPNVWIGVSAENQQTANERIPWLLKTPAAVRFVSAEPLLSDINFGRHFARYRSHVSGLRYCNKSAAGDCTDLGGIDWVIVGGESGRGARQCDLGWVRSIVDQCKSAGVACFVKQLGANAFYRHSVGATVALNTQDAKGGDPGEWPEDLRLREFPSIPSAV